MADRLRLRRYGDEPLDWPVFASAGRDGQPTYRWPSTLRRTVRTCGHGSAGLDDAALLARTHATVLDGEMTVTDRAKTDSMDQATFMTDAYATAASSTQTQRCSSTQQRCAAVGSPSARCRGSERGEGVGPE